MSDNTGTDTNGPEARTTRTRRRAASRKAGPPSTPPVEAVPVDTVPATTAPDASPARQAPAKTETAPRHSAKQKSGSSSGGRRGRHERGGDSRGRRNEQATPAPVDRLGTPRRLPKGGLRIVALGGIGEIGRNMTVFEYDGRLLIVDCGVLFPEDQQPGVDLILPDFRYIEDRMDDVDAVILTHGHEDHIGAIPFLLRLRGDIPVVGSKFTLALVEAKCREHRLRPKLVEVTEGERTDHGPFV